MVHDIGANIGTHAIACALAVGPSGRVVAFEPESKAASRLLSNVELNGLSNVLILNTALGKASGLASLFVNDTAGSGSHSLIKAPGRRAVSVEVAAGDEVIAQSNLPAPDFIKIDVEGAELDVISGLYRTLRSPQCKTVLCEVHRSVLEQEGNNISDVENALRQAGFSRFERMERRRESHVLAHKDLDHA